MLADFFTKPLQGALFRKFRDIILGHKHVDTLAELTDTAARERVGKRPTDGGFTTAIQDKDILDRKTKATWADVVTGEATQHHEKANKPARKIILSKQSC